MQDQEEEDVALRERIAAQVALVGWDPDLAEKMYRWVKNGPTFATKPKPVAAKPIANGNNGTAAEKKRVYTKRAKYWAKKKKA